MRVPLIRLLTTAAAALAALALAACGGSGASSSSASRAAHTSTGSSGGAAAAPSSSSSTSSASASASSTTSAATSGSGGAALAGTAKANACPTSALNLSFVSGQGAAGTAYMNYALTNRGPRTCTLYGYPGVAVLNAAGAIVQHPAQRGGIQAPTRETVVTLAHGSSARFILTSSDVIPSPGCPHSYSGVTLQVFPPGQRQALRIPYNGTFCNLHVGPVSAH